MTRDHITATDLWLVRQRHLSNPNHLEDLLLEAHNATMSNERASEIFKPLCQGNEKLGEWFVIGGSMWWVSLKIILSSPGTGATFHFNSINMLKDCL